MIKRIVLAAFLIISFVNGAYATDIELTWTPPELYEDGKAIDRIDRYNLYYSINNVVQNAIQIEAGSTNYTLGNVGAGSYTFQISATASGLESELSSPVTAVVSDSRPVKIELTVRVLE